MIWVRSYSKNLYLLEMAFEIPGTEAIFMFNVSTETLNKKYLLGISIIASNPLAILCCRSFIR